MKDRFVKLVDGKVKLISDAKKTKDLESLVKVQNEIMVQSQLLVELNNEDPVDESKVAQVEAHIVNLQSQETKLNEENDTYTKIAVADASFNNSGSSDWWVIDGDSIRKPNQSELDQREADKAQKKLEADLKILWDACYKYQLDCIDINTESELMFARNLVSTGAGKSNFPKAEALGDWKKSLYGLPNDANSGTGSYYARKNACIAGEPYSLDFSNFDPVPSSYIDIATEVAIYEASL